MLMGDSDSLGTVTRKSLKMVAKGEPVYYSPPPQQQQEQEQLYVLLPLYYHSGNRRRRYWRCLIWLSSLILLAGATFFIWPSDPEVQIVRLGLNHVRVYTSPRIFLDISLAVTVRVRNRDFFSLDYRSLVVSIGYRGRQLGFATSGEGHLRARGSSYVDATLDLDGLEILHDIFDLIQDLAKGTLPFETVSDVRGKLGLLFLEVPLKAKVSCEVHVNINNQTIVRQDCYPE